MAAGVVGRHEYHDDDDDDKDDGTYERILI